MPKVISVLLPDNPSGDCWLELFFHECAARQVHEPPLEVDQQALDNFVRAARSACLAEYGLHLKV